MLHQLLSFGSNGKLTNAHANIRSICHICRGDAADTRPALTYTLRTRPSRYRGSVIPVPASEGTVGDLVRITGYGGRVGLAACGKVGTITRFTRAGNPVIRLDRMVWSGGCFTTDITVTPAAAAALVDIVT